ncbi:hypothetical protein BH11PSE14_BH11PSE14_02260 [soil metagenome]
MMARWRDCGRSFLALPGWVKLWVGAILIPANALPFFFLDTPTGRAAALASTFVVLTNVPIILRERGMSRLMSVPRLIAWVPLLPYLVARLLFTSTMVQSEALLAIALFVINGISLVFDTLDTWRWLCGKRNIPGSSSSGQSCS